MIWLKTIRQLEEYAGRYDWLITHDDGERRVYMTPQGNFLSVSWDNYGNINQDITPIVWSIARKN